MASENSTAAINALSQSVATLMTTFKTKFDSAESSTATKIAADIDAAIQGMLGGVSEEGNTFKKLEDLITGLQTNVGDLNDIYASDAEVAANIKAVNDAWKAADTDINALIATMATKAELAASATQIKTDNDTYVDGQLTDLADTLTAQFDAGTTQLQA